MITAEDMERRAAGGPAPPARRVALVVLSGDRVEARAQLHEIAPGATVDEIAKAAFQPAHAARTVSAMRAARYDEVAFFCLSTRWQRRRAPLLALAVAGGARRVTIFNPAG